MAPIDPDLFNDNTRPLALLGSYVTLVVSLIALIDHRVLYRSYKALPPSQGTRSRQPHRRKQIATFVALNTLTLGLAVYYSGSILNVSYQVWAYERGDSVPSSLWGGDGVFTEDGNLALQLGRWLRDTDVIRDSWEIALSNSRRQWWTQQLLIGRAAWSLYVAIDARRRNIPHAWAFMALSGLVSLSFAQNLYGLAALLTPVPLSEAEKHSDLVHRATNERKHTRKTSKTIKNSAATAEATVTFVPHQVRAFLNYYFPPKPVDWTPHPLVYSVPVVLSVVGAVLTGFSTNTPSFYPLLILAYSSMFAPLLILRLCPLRFGTGSTKLAASRALNAFRMIALLSLPLHWSRTAIAVLDNDTSRHRHYYFFRDNKTVLQHTGSSVSRVLRAFEDHPACGAVAWDVILSGFSLIVWAGIRGLNGSDMLRSAGWASKKELELVGKAAKGVKNQIAHLVDHVSDGEEPEPITPKISKSRSRKGATSTRKTSGKAEAEATGESGEMASAYESDETTGWQGDEDKSEDWESGALSWGMLVLGGLGVQSSAVLGGEVA